MDTKAIVLKYFKKYSALLEGHFLLSSGRHSDRYLQCALILQYPKVAAKLAKMLTQTIPDEIKQAATVIVSPALGGVIWGQEVGRVMNKRAIFAERQDNIMTLRRGFKLAPEDNVIVAEDVVTTGKSTREVIEVVTVAGAKVIAAVSLVDRSGGKTGLGVPFFTLLSLEVQNWLPEECMLCKNNIPVIKPGSRKIV
ncbi:MAG: orotate phosphoribosyltransferase [Elusimicrobiota bacterium]